MNSQLEVQEASVAYGRHLAVDRVSLNLGAGEIGCLLGPSGCGKTTLLRAIAGFEPLTTGEILLHGRCVATPRSGVAPEQRRVGMVFQDFALFPHLSVAKNIAFGLRGQPKGQRRERVAELLELINLESLRKSYPHQLSGGQQQRVALARAMAPRPDILLLDEPFSSLDVELRQRLAEEVRNVLKRDGVTAILVTHDQMEAFAVADQVGVMHQGRLQQWDSGYLIYHQPANRFVADFVGRGTLLDAGVLDLERLESPLGIVTGAVPNTCRPGCPVQVLLRPDDIVLDRSSTLRGRIRAKAFRGSDFLYTVELSDGSSVLSLVSSHVQHEVGDIVGIRMDVRHLVVFAKEHRGQGAFTVASGDHNDEPSPN